MNFELTRIHLGREHTEVGVQFDVDDGGGGKVRQRAFLAKDDKLAKKCDALWADVEKALTAKLDQLPLDLPPANVTTALMKQRDAEAAAAQAQRERDIAMELRDEAKREREAHETAALQAETKCRNCEDHLARLTAEQTAREEELAKLDAEIAVRRAKTKE